MNPSAYLMPMAFAIGGVTFIMVVTWFFGRTLRNYGMVDAIWSYLFAPVAAFYALVGNGTPSRRIIIASLVTFWSLRLGTHLARRITREHPVEDRRYAALRDEWGQRTDLRMLGFYLLQGLLIVVLSIPFLLPTFNQAITLHPLEILGSGISLLGLLGESFADAQLSRFKREGASHESVCEVGLWRYSRHPNYFFEWLIWVGFATFALPSTFGWLGLIAPLLMLHFLLNVTGIPMTEELAVARKGDAYRRYQQTTSRFVPRPRKAT